MNETAAIPLFAAPDPGPDTRRFAAAVAVALALHVAAFALGLIPAPQPHQMGEETGSPEGLTVEIVDASELPSPAGASPPETAAAPSPPQAAQPPPVEPPAAHEATAEPSPPELKPSAIDDAPSAPVETPAPAPPQTPAPAQAEATAPATPPPVALDALDPDLLKLDPGSAQTPPRPQTPAAPANSQPQKSAKTAKPAAPAKPVKPTQLSLAVPIPSFSSNDQMTGRDAAMSRPPGITRSGLNDEFGRGVIRALRQTMPPPNGRQMARATVRFVLTPDGNLLEAEIVASSGDPILDRNIVFAVKQANFPIPATNLTAIDRQFRVTYIYR